MTAERASRSNADLADVTARVRSREFAVQPVIFYLPLAAIAFEDAYAVTHNPPLLHEKDVLEGLHELLRVSPPLSKSDSSSKTSAFDPDPFYLSNYDVLVEEFLNIGHSKCAAF